MTVLNGRQRSAMRA